MNHVKIDLERIVSDIDRNIFGGYIEFGPLDTRFDYLNVSNTTNAGKDGLRSDVQLALERMNLANIRFPGGNFASAYRWINGVGPREKRPTIFDLAGECSVDNRYGTNEFIRFCRKLKIEPYLCVNCGDGDMREAADWVEYCNGTGDAAPVKLRREHGFAEPHKVKYWGIGNEVDGPWQIGYKTPQEYARAVTEYSKVMKRVDPDIKLIAAGVSLWEDYPLPDFKTGKTEWVERAQLILEQAGDRIDYLSIHRYANPYDDDPFENYMAFTENYNEHLNAYEGLIRAVSLERGIKHGIGIAVDEWGLTRFHAENDVPVSVGIDTSGRTWVNTPDNSPRTRRRRVINLEDALVTALHLNCFIRHASSVRIANFHRIPRIGNNLTGPESPLLLPTILYPFELYSHTCGQLALDVFWHGETFSGGYGNRTYSGIRNLDVAATLDTGRKQLVVYVVNQSKDKAMETMIALTSGQFTGNVKISVVNGPDIKSENTIEKPNQVGTKKSDLTVSGKSFTYIFEPHSVTALVCAVS
jgi:alpha-N-arabinofuranosidase